METTDISSSLKNNKYSATYSLVLNSMHAMFPVACFVMIINRKTKNTSPNISKIDTPSIQMYDRSFPGFYTGTSIKSVGVKYVKVMLHYFLYHILALFYLFTF